MDQSVTTLTRMARRQLRKTARLVTVILSVFSLLLGAAVIVGPAGEVLAAKHARGGFNLTFDKVEFNEDNNTSQWFYTLTKEAGAKDLSHLSIEVCKNDEMALLGSDPSGAALGKDGQRLDWAVKWDRNILQGVQPDSDGNYILSVSFTVSGLWQKTDQTYHAFSASNTNAGTVSGPGCEPYIPQQDPKPKTGTLIIKKYEDVKKGKGDLLGGATFQISGPKGYSRLITDNEAGDGDSTAGIIKLTHLKPGKYTVTEVEAPTGYEIDEANKQKDAFVPGGGSVTVIFLNKPIPSEDPDQPKGKITICKVNEDNEPLSGATFKLEVKKQKLHGGYTWQTVEKNIPVDDCYTVTGLSKGTYRITEITAPKGYEIDEKNNPKQVELTRNHSKKTVVFKNMPESSDGPDPGDPDDPVEGEDLTVDEICIADPNKVAFVVTNPNDVDMDFTWQIAGDDEIHQGTVPAKESVVVETGYAGPNSWLVVNWDDNGLEVLLGDEPCLVIQKTDHRGRSLDGATFGLQVWEENEDGGEWVPVEGLQNIQTSGGEVTLSLEPGKYRVQEKSAPSGYQRVTEYQEADLTCDIFVPLAVIGNDNDEENMDRCLVVLTFVNRPTGGTPSDPGPSDPGDDDDGSSDGDDIRISDEPPSAGPTEPEPDEPMEPVVTLDEAPAAGPDLPHTGGSVLGYALPGLMLLGAGAYLRRRFTD